MEWLREAHRSPYELAVARHLPQALEPSSPSLEKRSAAETGAFALSAAPRRGQTSGRGLSRPQRDFQGDSGIERTGLADASTAPKSNPPRDRSAAEPLDIGDRPDCLLSWSDFLLDGLGDLAGHALLHLQATRKHIDHASNLAEPQNTLLRKIGHVSLPEEWQQVMFAEAEELDVLHDDHFVVGHAERCAVQYMSQVQVVTAGQILQCFLETLRCLAQPFAIGILSDDLYDFAHVAGDGARVEVLAVIQQNFFRWLVHGRFPSRFSPAYSKLLFPVSWTRIRSSFASGKNFKR